jgi:hypothetical protein
MEAILLLLGCESPELYGFDRGLDNVASYTNFQASDDHGWEIIGVLLNRPGWHGNTTA